MIYTKDTMPDGTIYESYEGTPEEIRELMNSMPRELKYDPKTRPVLDGLGNVITEVDDTPVVNKEELVLFIYEGLKKRKRFIDKGSLHEILELQDDYKFIHDVK